MSEIDNIILKRVKTPGAIPLDKSKLIYKGHLISMNTFYYLNSFKKGEEAF